MKGYLLHTHENGEISLCRVIREYSEEEKEQATEDWVSVTTGKISERELSKNGLKVEREGF